MVFCDVYQHEVQTFGHKGHLVPVKTLFANYVFLHAQISPEKW